MTWPLASSSGPPELPWLIAASVWIALPIGNLVSDWMSRFSAETTPTDSDCSSPNGLPIAATGSPTVRPPVDPNGNGSSRAPGPRSWLGSTLQQRDVRVVVGTDDAGRQPVAV